MEVAVIENRMPYARWNEDRRPLENEVADAERRARYWEWSAVGLFDDVGTRLVDEMSDGRCWRELLDERAADFEAFHMQHSIGYNWLHYSGFGTLISLREKDGVPSVTVLVAKDCVVHARRKENAPLLPGDLLDISALAEKRGWTMLPPEQL